MDIVVEKLRLLIERDPEAVLRAVEVLRREVRDSVSLAVLAVVEAAVRARLLSKEFVVEVV